MILSLPCRRTRVHREVTVSVGQLGGGGAVADPVRHLLTIRTGGRIQ